LTKYQRTYQKKGDKKNIFYHSFISLLILYQTVNLGKDNNLVF